MIAPLVPEALLEIRALYELVDLVKIVGRCNQLVHDYDSIRMEILWDIYREKLPLLQTRLIERVY